MEDESIALQRREEVWEVVRGRKTDKVGSFINEIVEKHVSNT